jgi:hypothetical protein
VYAAARGEERRQLESQRLDIVVVVVAEDRIAKFDRIVSGCVTSETKSVTNRILDLSKLDLNYYRISLLQF